MSSTPLSILLVDDDPDTCNLFSMIADYYHFQSAVVGDAETAYDYLAEHTPDVIILDIHLPGTDGYGAHRHIRERGVASTSAIIAATAYYTMDTPQEMIAKGFNGYIQKPFDPKTFVTCLQQAIRERRKILGASGKQA